MEYKEKIRRFVLKELCLDGKRRPLSDSEPLLEKGIIDSMGILHLIAFLDEKFGILLSDEELNPKNFESLESIYALVANKIKENP